MHQIQMVSGCHPLFSLKALTQLLGLSLPVVADLICHVEENNASVPAYENTQ